MEAEQIRDPEKQIISILNSYILSVSLVSSADALNIEEKKNSYLKLLKNPNHEGIKELISVLKTYDLLFETGVFPPGGNNRLPELMAYLHSLLPPPIDTKILRKRNISTLGASFIRNRYGVPLFGPLHPGSLPQEGGVLLSWTSSGEDDSVLITAAELTEGTQMNYEGLGIHIESHVPWMLMLLTKNSKGPSLSVRDPWLSEADHYSFSRYKLSMSHRPELCPAMSAFFDPLENCYVYYFTPGETISIKMLKYLSRTLSGFFGIPLRESEKIAQSFIQKLH